MKAGGTVKTAEATVWVRLWLKGDEQYKLTSWKFMDEKDEQESKPAPGETVDAAKPAGKAIVYTTHAQPYFVKNTFEPKAVQSFAVLKGLDEFHGVFGVGMVMGGKQPQINAETFQSQIIVAVVTRGAMCHYKVESVTAKGDGLEVRYQVKVDPADTAQHTVSDHRGPQGNYSSVTFVENGKEVKVLK